MSQRQADAVLTGVWNGLLAASLRLPANTPVALGKFSFPVVPVILNPLVAFWGLYLLTMFVHYKSKDKFVKRTSYNLALVWLVLIPGVLLLFLSVVALDINFPFTDRFAVPIFLGGYSLLIAWYVYPAVRAFAEYCRRAARRRTATRGEWHLPRWTPAGAILRLFSWILRIVMGP